MRSSRRAADDETDAGLAASPGIDIDKTIAAFCKADRRPLSDDIEAIDAWIAVF